MNCTTARPAISGVAVPVVYTLICLFAVGFDLSTDRSWGALMLAVLPISLVALGCLLVGPWREGRRRFNAARDWFIGALLVLLISIAFSSLGPDQAKTGELIFTYAILIFSLPASLMLPFLETSIELLNAGDFYVRIAGGWAICIVFGWLEWQILSWFFSRVFPRFKRN